MSFASKHNKGGIDWGIETEGFPYHKLEDIYKELQDKPLKVYGAYISNKGKFGPSPALISEGMIVNLPNHMVDTIKQILSSPEDIADIKRGVVFFRVRPYELKDDPRTFYSIEWVDAQAEPERAAVSAH